MTRLDRNRPLTEPSAPRVEDPLLQRVLTSLFTPLREVVQFLQPFVQSEKWKPLPPYDTTVDFGSGFQVAQYRKDPLGLVRVRGEITTSGAHGADHTIALLPPGYRPPSTTVFVVGDSSGSTAGLIEIHPDGRIDHIAGAHTQISLNLSFDTEA